MKPISQDSLPASTEAVQQFLLAQNYLADRSLATTLFLALRMGRPLFLEGEPGVGKTQVAKSLAEGLGRKLIRLQCYEGLDVASAVYEWNYSRQMLEIRLAEAGQSTLDKETLARDVFSEEFLIERPLLQSLRGSAGNAPVLLIDELDRADEPFEAYLLELLSEFQITIPELGTIKAEEAPIVIITSNRTREIHDALKRRCLYHWLDYPDVERELAIVKARLPGISERLSRQVVEFVQQLREQSLFKPPGIAETLDWAEALTQLQATSLDSTLIDETLGTLLKYQDDLASIRGDKSSELMALIQQDLAQL